MKAVYAYSPVHEDEMSIKANDVINVTRLVSGIRSVRTLSSGVFFPYRLKKVGMKVFSMEIVVYFHRIM